MVGGTVPKEYIPAVEKGIKNQCETGVLAGFPTVDFKYTLVDGKYHDVDSSALAFEIAAKACFRDGMKRAGPIILEPIMDVEVTTPQDHVGDVVGDLNRRRGTIQNQDSAGSSMKVTYPTPLNIIQRGAWTSCQTLNTVTTPARSAGAKCSGSGRRPGRTG